MGRHLTEPSQLQAENCYFSPSLIPLAGQWMLFHFERFVFFHKDLHFVEKLTGKRNLYLYKTRERIHRDVADSRLLSIPRSWGRIAAPNPH